MGIFPFYIPFKPHKKMSANRRSFNVGSGPIDRPYGPQGETYLMWCAQQNDVDGVIEALEKGRLCTAADAPRPMKKGRVAFPGCAALTRATKTGRDGRW